MTWTETTSGPATMSDFQWWVDLDGKPHVDHHCTKGMGGWPVPPRWGPDGYETLFHCRLCGADLFLSAADRVDTPWNWLIDVSILCGSCDGKPAPNPRCEYCGGTGVDRELCPHGSSSGLYADVPPDQQTWRCDACGFVYRYEAHEAGTVRMVAAPWSPLDLSCEYCGDPVRDHSPSELKSCVADLEADSLKRRDK